MTNPASGGRGEALFWGRFAWPPAWRRIKKIEIPVQLEPTAVRVLLHCGSIWQVGGWVGGLWWLASGFMAVWVVAVFWSLDNWIHVASTT